MEAKCSIVAGRKLELGDTGAAVARNVSRLRKAIGLNYTDLSTRLANIGRDIPPLAVRRIEEGNRRVDVDDLVALAIALGVSPATLLMPAHEAADSPVSVTGAESLVTARSAWYWLAGQDPIPPMVTPDWTVAKFRAYAWPEFVQVDYDRGRDREMDLELRAQGFRFPDGDDQ